MFCTHCGNNLEAEDNFCGQCGKAVRRPKTVESTQTQIRTEAPATRRPIVNESIVHRQSEYTPPPTTPPRSKTAESKSEKKKEELRADLRKFLEKRHKREITDQELFEAEHWLTGYAELMLDLGIKEAKRQKKLEDNPKGFHLEGRYSCAICGSPAENDQSWYDEHGIKCMVCQDAINKGIIPATVASDRESWYSMHDFEHHFFVNRFGVRRWIKEGLLKPRVIPGSAGGVHYQLFLIEDHKDILPPKKLTEWPTVKEVKDGEEYYHSEPWAMHANPMEVLKDYKILEYLKGLKEKEVKQSYPQLSFQLNKSARLMTDINYIGKKDSEEIDNVKSL